VRASAELNYFAVFVIALGEQHEARQKLPKLSPIQEQYT
jgi:hypothetical protein